MSRHTLKAVESFDIVCEAEPSDTLHIVKGKIYECLFSNGDADPLALAVYDPDDALNHYVHQENWESYLNRFEIVDG